MDAVYTITIRRYADKDLPLITDEDGTKYFDNKIDLKILRKDGTTFIVALFQRTISSLLQTINMGNMAF